MSFVRHCVLICIFFISIPHRSSAISKLGLVIGINHYSPPDGATATNHSRLNYTDLKGAVNDAMAVRSVFCAKYGFALANIDTLYDKAATRANILAALENLLAKVNKGDIVFIYYAGHGSQTRNSKSAEDDKYDETIVPADAWKEGVPDIRDKELNQVFNRFLDRGANLTVIFDCCHSGNIDRGYSLFKPSAARFIGSSDYDVADATRISNPSANENGSYLMLSACQEYDKALETEDDNGDAHGSFTLSLLQAINQHPADAPAESIFNSARAILKSNSKTQEPDLNGKPGRKKSTLLNISPANLPDRLLVPVIAVKDKKVILEGGFVTGINEGIELKLIDGNVKIRIEELAGVCQARAVVIEGDIKNVKPGQFFEVDNWVSGKASFLKVFLPVQSIKQSDLPAISKSCEKLAKNNSWTWINDPAQKKPDIIVYYEGGKWFASTGAGRAELEGGLEGLKHIAAGKSVFINIPPTEQMCDSFKARCYGTKNVEIVNDPSIAQYALCGRYSKADNKVSYSLAKIALAPEDSLEQMPQRSTFFQAERNIGPACDSLFLSALRLAKVRAWINLTTAHLRDNYPFHLAFRQHGGMAVNSGKIGDTLGLWFEANDHYMDKWEPKRGMFVYVFLIDSHGGISLMFPDENTELPILNGNEFVPNKKLTDIVLSAPSGTDTYYMLYTKEQIIGFQDIFSQPEVMTEGTKKGGGGLNALINLGNLTTRDPRKIEDGSWGIQRTTLKTEQ